MAPSRGQLSKKEGRASVTDFEPEQVLLSRLRVEDSGSRAEGEAATRVDAASTASRAKREAIAIRERG